LIQAALAAGQWLHRSVRRVQSVQRPGTDRTNLVKVGGQWTHLFGGSIETNINGGFVQSFFGLPGIVATVTGDGTVPTIGNQSWFEYGGRVGFRLTNGWVADLFLDWTAGPQPVGNTLHGGV
jgi:hypothetical protein